MTRWTLVAFRGGDADESLRLLQEQISRAGLDLAIVEDSAVSTREDSLDVLPEPCGYTHESVTVYDGNRFYQELTVR